MPELFESRASERVAFDIKNTLEYPTNIRVENGGILVKGEAQDCARGVTTDAPKRHQALKGVGELPVKVSDYLLGDAVEPPGTEVVAEWSPQLLNLLQRRCRQGGEGGVGGEKFMVLGDDAVHLGLVEHHLGDENAVGVVGVPPREISTMLLEPLEQPALKSLNLFWYRLVVLSRRLLVALRRGHTSGRRVPE